MEGEGDDVELRIGAHKKKIGAKDDGGEEVARFFGSLERFKNGRDKMGGKFSL